MAKNQIFEGANDWLHHQNLRIIIKMSYEQLSKYVSRFQLAPTDLNEVQHIVKGSLDSIPSPSVKIRIMGG